MHNQRIIKHKVLLGVSKDEETITRYARMSLHALPDLTFDGLLGNMLLIDTLVLLEADDKSKL